jgi:UDP-N-acetylmuramoylalanine--D-glutamate ligase
MTTSTSTNAPPCPECLRHRRGRRFVVVGGGKTGAAAARLLVREGAIVTVVDDGAHDKVSADLAKHGADLSAITIVAGGIDQAVIDGADVVVLSPGVPRAHAALQHAVTRGAPPIVNELELGLAVLTDDGAALDGVRLVAITGTNGKSTTTTMAGAIAAEQDPLAFVGGNLGTPLCAAIADGLVRGSATAPRLLVVELSSYQLETLRWFPATAATVTNLTPDHLDRYPSVDAYYAAKAWLLALTIGGVSCNAKDPNSQHTLVPAIVPGTTTLHFDVAAGLDGIAVGDSAPGHLRLTVRHADTVRILNVDNPLIVGHHNRQNAAAAAAVAILSGISDEHIVAGLTAYAGIAHRLERVGVHRGVSWWNDSKATNVDAAVTALRSFNGGVHLIVGGVGKGSSYAPLVDAARVCVKAVYTIGADAPALQDAFAGSGIDIRACGTLQGACSAAAAIAVAGDHVVLSPACASFDQFRDYTHRGAEFRICFAAAQGEP